MKTFFIGVDKMELDHTALLKAICTLAGLQIKINGGASRFSFAAGHRN